MALFELASARLSARPQAPSFPSYGCSWPNLLLEAAGKLCVSRRLNWCWILLLALGPGPVSPAPQRWEGGHPLGLLLPPEKHWPRAQPAYCYLLVLLSSELSSPGGLSLSCCVKMEPQQWFWCCWAVGLTGFGSSLLHCVYRKCCGRHLCDAVCGFNEGTALGLILIHKWAVCCGSPDMQEAHCTCGWAAFFAWWLSQKKNICRVTEASWVVTFITCICSTFRLWAWIVMDYLHFFSPISSAWKKKLLLQFLRRQNNPDSLVFFSLDGTACRTHSPPACLLLQYLILHSSWGEPQKLSAELTTV